MPISSIPTLFSYDNNLFLTPSLYFDLVHVIHTIYKGVNGVKSVNNDIKIKHVYCIIASRVRSQILIGKYEGMPQNSIYYIKTQHYLLL